MQYFAFFENRKMYMLLETRLAVIVGITQCSLASLAQPPTVV